MPLKIIGAGFGRTSTNSTHAALNQLGFPCYHMLEVLENRQNKSHMDFWLKVANSEPDTQHDWEQVFSGYTATVDNPACCVWRELMVAYPDAKVLLTVHPAGPEAWYESTMETIYFTETSWQFGVLAWVVPMARKMGDMGRKLIWQRSHRGTLRDRDAAIAHYRQHIEDVRSSVSPDRLLVFSAKEGWKPLCDFLQVPIPASAFPNVNDRAEFKSRLAKMRGAAYAILGLGTAAVSAVVYAGSRLLS